MLTIFALYIMKKEKFKNLKKKFKKFDTNFLTN